MSGSEVKDKEANVESGRSDAEVLQGIADDFSPEERAEYGKLAQNDPGTYYVPDGDRQTLVKRAKVKLNSKRSRRNIVIAGALGGSMIMLVVLLIVFISTLMIPNFMQHVTGYQFTRTARDYIRNSEQIQGEKFMLDTAAEGAGAAERGFFRGMADRYTGLSEGFWEKINSYRPQKVVENLETSGRLTYVYEDGASVGGFTRQRLTAIIIDGEEISASNPTLGGRLRSPIKTFTDKISFRSDLKTGVERSLEGRTTLFRSFVAKDIRARVDAKLVRWVRSSNTNDPKNPDSYRQSTQVADELTARSNAAVATDEGQAFRASAADGSENVKQAEGAAEDALENCFDATPCLDDTIKTASTTAEGLAVPATVNTAIESSLGVSTLESVASTVSTAAAVAIPLCLIYDGSLEKSGPSIDAQTDSDMRMYQSAATIANQQEDGQQVTADALGAFGRALQGRDGIGASIPELRANGRPYDTSEFQSAQAAATGDFTLIDAIPGIPQIAKTFFSSAANEVCPRITNTYAIAGLAIGETLLAIGSGGSVSLADQTLKTFVTISLREFIQKFSVKAFVRTLVVQGAAIGGATLLAKMVVANRAAVFHSGLNRGQSLVANIDAGGNATGNYMEQRMFRGIPMNTFDVQQSMIEDRTYLAHEQSQLPFTQRYFALTNPDSLLTKFGTTVASFINVTTLNKLLNNIGHMFNPFSTFKLAFSHWGTGTALAASNVDTANYGQIQFGWSSDEEAKIASDASYQHPLENRRILDASGQRDLIETTFKDCFEETVGQLLSEGKVQRDADGNVLDGANIHCSKTNLSYNSPQFGDKVFRWRIAGGHSNTLQHATEIANPIEDTPDADIPGGNVDIAGCPTDSAPQDQTVLVGGIRVHTCIAQNLTNLLAAAQADGINLGGGGWRSAESQVSLRISHGCGGSRIYDASCKGSPPTAVPGRSRHERGTAIDFSYQGGTLCYPLKSASCHNNAGFDWLVAHAGEYGFKNLPSEAWHWSVDGH